MALNVRENSQVATNKSSVDLRVWINYSVVLLTMPFRTKIMMIVFLEYCFHYYKSFRLVLSDL